MANLYVCKACGEPYIGEDPQDCPFCGAPKGYLRPAEEFRTIWDAEMTPEEKKDMEATLKLETNAAAYYADVTESQEKYSRYNRLYKQLERVEREHAKLACKFLKIGPPEFNGEKNKGDIKEDLKRTFELEHTAVELYSRFLKNAKSSKIRLFYSALIHAEKGHEEIAGAEIRKASE